MTGVSVQDLRGQIGARLGTSRWFPVDQARIDAFADVTEDHQYIHIDPERAAQTPFGGTVAHGFLTLSLLSAMAYDGQPEIAGAQMSVNYGMNRLRFVSPVRAGGRVRAHFTLSALEENKPGEVTVTWAVEVEIEGQERPAIVCDWLQRHYLGAT